MLYIIAMPCLRDRAIQNGFLIEIRQVARDADQLKVEFEVHYDRRKAGLLGPFAPGYVFVDRGLLSSCALPGQQVEWLMPDGSASAVSDWVGVDDVNPGRDIVAVESGESIKATIATRPDKSNWHDSCRLVEQVVYYCPRGHRMSARPRFVKEIDGVSFAAYCVPKTSAWFSICQCQPALAGEDRNGDVAKTAVRREKADGPQIQEE